MRQRIEAWWRGLSGRGKVFVGFLVVMLLAISAGTRREPADTAVGPSPGPSPTPVVSSPNPTASPMTPPPVVPASPSPEAESVAQYGGLIPGLTAANIARNLETRGLTCESPQPFMDGFDQQCNSDMSDPFFDERVEIIGFTPTDLLFVESVYFWYGDQSQLKARSDEFLGYMASISYERATPNEAREWVQGTTSGERIFGRAKYVLTSGEDLAPTRVLTITGIP